MRREAAFSNQYGEKLFTKKEVILGGLYIALIAIGILAISGFYRIHRNVLDIVEHPDPILRLAAKPIAVIDDEILSLAENMVSTLRYRTIVDFFAERSVPRGLAAPQVGISKRLIVCGLNGKIKVMVNPEIVKRQGNYEDMDGCLSVAGQNDIAIERSAYVKIRYKTLGNKEKTLVVKDDDAALVEHEIDHLNGVLNIDY